MTSKNNISIICLCAAVLFITACPACILAQSNRDVPSTEAYIASHKSLNSQMLALTAIETANASLHNLMRKEVEEQSSMEDRLKRYAMAFEIIDVVMSSVQTLTNGYLTYQDIKEIMPKYVQVIETYKDQVKSRKTVEAGDTIIFTTATKCLGSISRQVECIALTLGNMAVTFASPAGSKTSTMLQTMRSINGSIDAIRMAMTWLYERTWHYVNIRRVYFSKAVVRFHTKQELCDISLAKWREKQRLEHLKSLKNSGKDESE